MASQGQVHKWLMSNKRKAPVHPYSESDIHIQTRGVTSAQVGLPNIKRFIKIRKMDRERQKLLTAVELDTPTRRQSESSTTSLFWTWQLLQISYQIYQMNISDYTSSLCSFWQKTKTKQKPKKCSNKHGRLAKSDKNQPSAGRWWCTS